MTVSQEQYDVVQEVVSTEEITEEVVEEESNVFEEAEEILPDHVKIEECIVDAEAGANGDVEEHNDETFLSEEIFANSAITREFADEDVFVNEVTIEDVKEEPVNVSQE